MADLKVRNLDDRVADALRVRATAKGVSLEQEVRDTLAESVGPDREHLYDALLDIRKASKRPRGVKPSDSVAIIRSIRNEIG